MKDSLFQSGFKIRIDSSQCTSLISGSAFIDNTHDVWVYKDIQLESGKIYGFVGEYGQGNMYLSYLLGGKIDFGNLRLFCNDTEISKNDLSAVSWNLEPSNEPYKNSVVRKSIEKAIKKNALKENFEDVADKFLLTEPRYGRKLRALSGERWRASAALGYASRKKIFYAPYNTSRFYYHMCQTGLLKVLKELTDSGAMVFLPVGSDDFIKHIADECIYIKESYEVDKLKPSSIR